MIDKVTDALAGLMSRRNLIGWTGSRLLALVAGICGLRSSGSNGNCNCGYPAACCCLCSSTSNPNCFVECAIIVGTCEWHWTCPQGTQTWSCIECFLSSFSCGGTCNSCANGVVYCSEVLCVSGC